MPNFSLWAISDADGINASLRAVDAWNRILQRPYSITLRRDGASVSAQTVRVEVQNNKPTRQQTAMGERPLQQVIVFGVKGHPSITDTSMVIGDRFVYESKEYRMVSVSTQPGEIQGFGEVVE